MTDNGKAREPELYTVTLDVLCCAGDDPKHAEHTPEQEARIRMSEGFWDAGLHDGRYRFQVGTTHAEGTEAANALISRMAPIGAHRTSRPYLVELKAELKIVAETEQQALALAIEAANKAPAAVYVQGIEVADALPLTAYQVSVGLDVVVWAEDEEAAERNARFGVAVVANGAEGGEVEIAEIGAQPWRPPARHAGAGM